MSINLTTPSEINESVRMLQKKLPCDSEPVFLELQREPDAQLADCYGNVEKKVKRDGGQIQYGWCVWYAENKLIEAEFHAVWRSPDNELIDITPKHDGEERILFFPDNNTKYNNQPIDNIRVALSEDPNVHKIIHQNEERVKLMQQYNDGSGNSLIPMTDFLQIFGGSNPTRKIGRNERCYCGSGKKYKHCCLKKQKIPPCE